MVVLSGSFPGTKLGVEGVSSKVKTAFLGEVGTLV